MKFRAADGASDIQLTAVLTDLAGQLCLKKEVSEGEIGFRPFPQHLLVGKPMRGLIVLLPQEAAQLHEMGGGTEAVLFLRIARPQGVLVEGNPLPSGNPVYHRADPSVSEGKRLLPACGGPAVP